MEGGGQSEHRPRDTGDKFTEQMTPLLVEPSSEFFLPAPNAQRALDQEPSQSVGLAHGDC